MNEASVHRPIQNSSSHKTKNRKETTIGCWARSTFTPRKIEWGARIAFHNPCPI